MLPSLNPLIEIGKLPKRLPVNQGYRAVITALEDKVASLPNAMFGDCLPLKHSFAEGVYIRTMIIPKGTILSGKIHKDSFLNCFMTGDMTILTEKGIARVQAPQVYIAPPGSKKFGYAHEQVLWVSAHPNPTNSTDIDWLDKQLHVDSYEELDHIVETPTGTLSVTVGSTEFDSNAVFAEFLMRAGFDLQEIPFLNNNLLEVQR